MRKSDIAIRRVILLLIVIILIVPVYLGVYPSANKGYSQKVAQITADTYRELQETDEMYGALPYRAAVTEIYIDQKLGDAQVSVGVSTSVGYTDAFEDWLIAQRKAFYRQGSTFWFSYFLSDEHTQFGARTDCTDRRFTTIYWSAAAVFVLVLLLPWERVKRKKCRERG